MGVRLHIIVEGQTEETFVNSVLREHFAPLDIWVYARCVLTSRRGGKKYRGGVVNYQQCLRDINQWLKQDRESDARFSSLFDLYRLPSDFPGYKKARGAQDPYEKVDILENALGAAVGDRRFVPHLQLHEFEALLFCDPSQLGTQFDEREVGIKSLADTALQFGNPELINDRPDRAPSKRIIAAIPEYEARKASAGPIVAQHIGLQELRRQCRHFDEWVNTLEALV